MSHACICLRVLQRSVASRITRGETREAMSTGSDFSDEPQHAPWATAGSQDSSTYTPTIEDATNDIPILQITTRAEYTPRTTPHGLLLTESDEELLLASELYEALQDTTDATVLLDEVVMNPFTPIPTSDDVNVAHTRSFEDWAINTIQNTDDPVLRQLLHAEAPVLDSILFYIKDMAPHSNTLFGNSHNAWPWYHTEWMSALFLLQQLRLRMTI